VKREEKLVQWGLDWEMVRRARIKGYLNKSWRREEHWAGKKEIRTPKGKVFRSLTTWYSTSGAVN